jgi:Arc/MetJ family transcription regulator
MAVATNLKLDDALIDLAVKAGGHKTKQAAVNAAIAEYVQRRNRLRILELGGKVDFDPGWDYKKLRRGKT